MIYITGPGHGGPGLVANTYLEGTYSEVYPHISQDEDGMKRLFKQFSFPGGIPSHVAPETPGSIHEGGELGYSLSHAYGAAFDNPDLIVACVVGDGEAETGPLADELALEQVSQPRARRRRAADPASERLQDRRPDGAGAHPARRARGALPRLRLHAVFCRGRRSEAMHQRMAATLDTVDRRDPARSNARPARTGFTARPRWPMIVLRTPKGLDGPEGGGRQADRRHLPLASGADGRHEPSRAREAPGEVDEELPAGGAVRQERAGSSPSSRLWRPQGERRMSANPHANGGLLLRDLRLPDFRDYAVKVPQPGAVDAEATRVQGQFIRDVIKQQPATTSASSARTKRPRTAGTPCSK